MHTQQIGQAVKAHSSLAQRYQNTCVWIESLARQYRRPPDSITLVAVSKRHSADDVAKIACMGQHHFAENYVQEGKEKIPEVASLLQSGKPELPLVWHFIGHIQSRKCRDVALMYDWVHTVESEKVAIRLNRFRDGFKPLNVLVQINLQQETGKSGISADRLEDLVLQVSGQPNLELQGLMIIPRTETDFLQQRKIFRQMRELLEQKRIKDFGMSQLSMGMSGDVEAAIAEGSTMVRLGTAIFGPRPH